jgi:hypothetical protein
MTREATVAHHMAGRTRFRIPAGRGDRSYFTRLSEQLGQCPGVLSVTTNALTGSVLVFHEAADPDVLVAYARTFDLFEVKEEAVSALDRVRPPAEILSHRLERMDHWVRSETRQATDLRSLALTGLVAAALWQLLRGQVFPAAGTLVWYALSVASNRGVRSGAREGRTSDKEISEEIDSPVA